jgi:hypothetical protein
MNQFWKDVLDSAALVLGLGISINTIYEIVKSQVVKSRQFRMLIEELNLAFGIHLELIKIVSSKANKFIDEDMPKPMQQNLPALSKKAKDALADIISRTENILDSSPEVNLSNWAGLLKKNQLAKLMDFLEAYRLYQVRLELRLEGYKSTPDRADVLGRFLASAAMQEGLGEKFETFKKSLGVKQTKKQESE